MIENMPQNNDPCRKIYSNRTLNLRSIRAVGYDMDYTLVHYHVKKWEALAFHFLKKRLLALNWPVSDANFLDEFGMRGLVIDQKLGNIVKANRFGYVKKAMHGSHTLEFEALKAAYNQDFIDLNDRRWNFVNTFFSLSELCMFAHAVDALDSGKFPSNISYDEIAHTIRRELDAAHLAGDMKRVIEADPSQYVDLDPNAAQMLIDQRGSGKKIMLITNSDWTFTHAMMSFAYDRFMPNHQTWTDLFDLIVVSARKPAFFTQEAPIYEVSPNDYTLKPTTCIRDGHKIYEGGNANLVEDYLGFAGDAILYAGDHVFSDVNISKAVRRWRTCLILRELEAEIEIQQQNQDAQKQLRHLMEELIQLDDRIAHQRLAIQRDRLAHGNDAEQLKHQHAELRKQAEELELAITPKAIAQTHLYNENWGLLMRTGNDKSLMARQMEQHADIYTSRVSNFLWATPYAYLRSSRGSLPHDE